MKLSENEVIIELENRVEENEHRISELENQLSNVIEAIKPLAIGNEQLWKVVFNDIIKAPVPDGIDVTTLTENL